MAWQFNSATINAASRSTVVVADPHLIMRHLLKTSLEATKAYNVVGEADSGKRVVEVVKSLKPNILILDLDLCGSKPINEIVSQGLATKIVTLTGQEDGAVASHAIEAGASACLCRNSSWQDLLEAIKRAEQGDRVISPSLSSLIERSSTHKKRRNRTLAAGVDPALLSLSAREREVFILLAQGFANRFVASKLSVSPRTIETHRARILRKLNLKSSSDLVRYSIKHGILAA